MISNDMYIASILVELCKVENGYFVCKTLGIWCRSAFGVGLRYRHEIFILRSDQNRVFYITYSVGKWKSLGNKRN